MPHLRRGRSPSPELRRRLLARDAAMCIYCGAWSADGLVLDHVEPLAAGGGDGADNLAAACWDCNSEKASDPLLVFVAKQAWRARPIGWRAGQAAYVNIPPPRKRLRRRVAFCPERMLADRRFRGVALRVYVTLSATTDDDGWCWPNGRELAEMVGCEAKVISQCLRLLEASGYLRRHRVSTAVGPQLLVQLTLTAAERQELSSLPPLEPMRVRSSSTGFP